MLNPKLCHLPDVAARLRLPCGWALPRNSHNTLGESAAFWSHQGPLCFLGLTAEHLPAPVELNYLSQETEATTQAAETTVWGPGVASGLSDYVFTFRKFLLSSSVPLPPAVSEGTRGASSAHGGVPMCSSRGRRHLITLSKMYSFIQLIFTKQSKS